LFSSQLLENCVSNTSQVATVLGSSEIDEVVPNVSYVGGRDPNKELTTRFREYRENSSLV
jgi:hypothetical protein